jgi:hypothetical protein
VATAQAAPLMETEVAKRNAFAGAPQVIEPSISEKARFPYLAAAIVVVLLTIALGAWYFVNRRGESAWSEIRIAPLNGLPRQCDAAFSPDGNQVAFDWAGEKGKYAHVYISQIGATDSPRQLTNTGEGAFEFAPVWSPDGRYIAFYRFDGKEQTLAIFVTAALGSSERH